MMYHVQMMHTAKSTLFSTLQFQDVKEMILKDIVEKGKEAKLASFEQVWLQGYWFYRLFIAFIALQFEEDDCNSHIFVIRVLPD